MEGAIEVQCRSNIKDVARGVADGRSTMQGLVETQGGRDVARWGPLTTSNIPGSHLQGAPRMMPLLQSEVGDQEGLSSFSHNLKGMGWDQ